MRSSAYVPYRDFVIWTELVGSGRRVVIFDAAGKDFHKVACEFGSEDAAIREAQRWIDCYLDEVTR